MITSSPADPSEPFPFMKLPPEIRLMVYEIAIQHTIATALSIPYDQLDVKGPDPPRLGAIALVYASDITYRECSRAMYRIADGQFDISLARHKSFYETWCDILLSPGGLSSSDEVNEVKSEAWSRYIEALIQTHWIGKLCHALTRTPYEFARSVPK